MHRRNSRAAAQKGAEGMSWKKLRGVPLPYEKQVYIRSVCLLHKEQPQRIREKIQRLCKQCGGVYSAALFDMMCTKKSVLQISMEHSVSESVLYDLRRAFFMAW